MSNKWIGLRGNPQSPKRLFCFHHAGGSASAFSSWVAQFPSSIELCAVQLPGRWDRMDEKLHHRIQDLVEELDRGMANELEKPFAILGYSLGALIGFEWARLLRKKGKANPVHFFAVSRVAPTVPLIKPNTYDLPDDGFLSSVNERYGQMAKILEQDEELRKIWLPVLRADVEMFETYKYFEQAPLDCPLTALYGAADHIVSKEKMAEWGRQTAKTFDLIEKPGGHFFTKGKEKEIADLILSRFA